MAAAKGKEEITSFDVLRGLLNDSDKSLFQPSGDEKKPPFPLLKKLQFCFTCIFNFPK